MEDEAMGREANRAEILQTGRRLIYLRREEEKPRVRTREVEIPRGGRTLTALSDEISSKIRKDDISGTLIFAKQLF